MNISRILSKKRFSRGIGTISHKKFPLTTPVGQLRKASADLPHKDILFFAKQGFRWSFKQLDEFASAFGYGLVEYGYKPTEKLLIWADLANSPEILAAQFGAAKAGICVVLVNSQNIEDLESALTLSDCKGLMISPYSKIKGGSTKIQALYNLIPELESHSIGDELKTEKFKNLKEIIQLSHATLPGTIKFKQHTVYASPTMTTNPLPSIIGSQPCLEVYNSGKRTNYSHEELLNKAKELWIENDLKSTQSVMLPLPITFPLAFASVISAIEDMSYVTIPGTYIMNDIYKLIETQNSKLLVSDKDFYQTNPPADKANIIKEQSQTIKKVIVGVENAEQKLANKSNVFDVQEAIIYDEYLINKI